jgi:hypothetical protein
MGIHVASAVVYRVPGDSFHGTQIDNGLYKVEVCRLMLLDVPLLFPNHKDDPPQLELKKFKAESHCGIVQ